MTFDLFAQITAIDEEKELEKQLNFSHQTFHEDFLNAVSKKPAKFKQDIYEEVVRDGQVTLVPPITYPATIQCCPEPLQFIDAFQDTIGDVQAARQLMKALIAGEQTHSNALFQQLHIASAPDDNSWFNTTKEGVHLRPGVRQSEGQTYAPIRLNDLSVHGVVVGRTGAGKSVFLNNLILNMLTEYAPWELDLYLADFKKIELSRYMSAGAAYTAPHLKTCAATAEIRYVITMLEHLVDCMQARQDLFTRLGIQKLSDFRSKFNVVLPRIVLVVDEFQQLFQEATTSEGTIIRELLLSIIKLGRATGFHLLFASQEMAGALTGKALANFKVRFALPCDSAVSSEILGNPAAATLERGYVLVNTENGDSQYNQLYRVPFVKDSADEELSDSYFYQMLAQLVEQTKAIGYEKRQTFYHEDTQHDIATLRDILTKIEPIRAYEVQRNPQVYDIITLGYGVVYSEKKYDLETFYIERGRNRNVLAICPNVDDLAYVQKLLALNIQASPAVAYTRNFYYNFHPLLAAKYDITEDLAVETYDTAESLQMIKMEYYRKLIAIEAINEPTILQFFDSYTQKLKAYIHNNELQRIADAAHTIFADNPTGQAILDVCEAYDQPHFLVLTEAARYYYYGHYYYPVVEQTNVIPWHDIFEPRNYWLSGLEYIEQSMTTEMYRILRNGMTVNLLFFTFCSSSEIYYSDIVSVSDYLFASGHVETIYQKLGMTYTKKARKSVVIDFKIKSLNTERSFKKYKIQSNAYAVPGLNFDDIL